MDKKKNHLHNPIRYAIITEQKIIIESHPPFADVFDKKLEDIIEKDLSNLLPELNSFKFNGSYEYTVSNDKQLNIILHLLPLTEYNDKRFLVLIEQFDQKQNYIEQVEELKNEIHLYQELLNAIYDGVHITDGEGNILYVNDTFLSFLNETRENYINNNIFNLLSKKYSSNNVTTQVLKTYKPLSAVVEYHNSGKKCLVSGTPVFMNGKLIRVIAIVRDLTQLNSLQEELLKANSLAQIYKNRLQEMEVENNNPVITTSRSKAMQDIYDKIVKISNLNTSVLILGETGVGKDHLAKYIHTLSNQAGDFIKINCSAIPHQLLESELFGYDPGAFTGAHKNGKAGLFELAHNGTLFLDEIGDMPIPLQIKLLAAIQDKKITRLGSTKVIHIQTRIIAATNALLEDLIVSGKFRKDLYYRLNVVQIIIPPLRQRKDDIIPLSLHFMEEYNKLYNKSCYFSSKAMEILIKYHWPGNIRELRNTVERIVIFSDQSCIDNSIIRDNLLDNQDVEGYLTLLNPAPPGERKLKQIVENFEAFLLREEIIKHETLGEAAASLGIDLSTLMRKKRKYGIKLPNT